MTAVDLSLLAELLADRARRFCPDPSPVRDASETYVVDMNFRVDPAFATAYVQRRLLYALDRLSPASPSATHAAASDALIVLGAVAHLRELQAVAA